MGPAGKASQVSSDDELETLGGLHLQTKIHKYVSKFIVIKDYCVVH